MLADVFKIEFLYRTNCNFIEMADETIYDSLKNCIDSGNSGNSEREFDFSLKGLKTLYCDFVLVKNTVNCTPRYLECGEYLGKILDNYDMENEMKPIYTRCNRDTVSYLLACIQSTFGIAVREYGDLQGQLTGDGVLYIQICVDDLDYLVEDFAYIRGNGFVINNEQTFIQAGDYVTNLVNIARTQSKMKPFDSELEDLINKHGIDNATGVPDYILAAFMVQSLEPLKSIIKNRDKWLGHVEDDTKTFAMMDKVKKEVMSPPANIDD